MSRSTLTLIAAICLFSCQTTTKQQENKQVVSYLPLSYAKMFGIADFGEYRRLFYLNETDTLWSLKSNELGKDKSELALLSSVFAGFVEALDQRSSIVALDNFKFYCDSLLISRIQSNDMAEIGEEGSINTSKLLEIKPDLLIGSSLVYNDRALVKRLKNSGIEVLKCDNFKEQHPLARAEWIKFFGFLLNCSEKADSIFKMVETSYLQLADSAAYVKNRTLVMTDAMYMDVWNVPGGNSYTSKLIFDAGGDYIFKNKTPLHTYPMNLEAMIKASDSAEVWLHVNQFHSKSELLQADKRYAYFKPFKTDRVFNNNKRENQYGGNDFWETGVVRPDLVLKDLIYILRSSKISNDKLYFYTHLN